jgi:2-hydroxychromene-2-carboxylate isomerase
MARLAFFYDYSCPYAYLAHFAVEAVCARTGAELVWEPFLLGGVFQAIGTPVVPDTMMPASKARMNVLDIRRYADLLGVPLKMPPTHPNRTVLALRATIATGEIPRASKALYKAYWADGEDVSKPEIVRAVLDAAGLDGAAAVDRANDPAIKSDLRARTDRAVAAGVFGAPALVVAKDGHEPELFWGQDRLDFVERALGGDVKSSDVALTNPPASPSRRPKELSFFFDFSSPFAYLGATQVEALAARQGATLRYRPFLLGALFKSIGTPNVPLFAMPPAKQRYYQRDLARWADHWSVPFVFPTRFPMNTVKALRVLLQLDDADRRRVVLPIFRAYWVHDRDISDDATLQAILREAGLDATALLAGAHDDSVKDRLRHATEEARTLGVCGAPCFLVNSGRGDEQLFWGQDRLDLVERALAGWTPRIAS